MFLICFKTHTHTQTKLSLLPLCSLPATDVSDPTAEGVPVWSVCGYDTADEMASTIQKFRDVRNKELAKERR